MVIIRRKVHSPTLRILGRLFRHQSPKTGGFFWGSPHPVPLPWFLTLFPPRWLEKVKDKIPKLMPRKGASNWIYFVVFDPNQGRGFRSCFRAPNAQGPLCFFSCPLLSTISSSFPRICSLVIVVFKPSNILAVKCGRRLFPCSICDGGGRSLRATGEGRAWRAKVRKQQHESWDGAVGGRCKNRQSLGPCIRGNNVYNYSSDITAQPRFYNVLEVVQSSGCTVFVNLC